MQRKKAVPLLLFALSGLTVLYSQPARVPVVLVLLHSPQGTETPSLRALIVDAISVELEAHDASTVASDDAVTGSSEVFAIAEKKQADFAINGTYRLQGKDVELAVSWYDLGERKVFPEVKASGLLDLSFDSVVSRLVEELLDRHEQRLASLPPFPAPTAPGQPVTTPAPSPSVDRVSPSSLPSVRPKASPLSFSVGTAPFIPLFKASAYIPTVGLSFAAEGEYRFPFGAGLLGISGASGIHIFHAEKASVADAFAVPIAGGIVYRTVSGSLIDFAVKALAGPAIFGLTPAGGETSFGLVPFLSTGLSVTMNLSALLAASVNFDYVAILVPDAIMGFAPSVAIDMRL